MGQLDGDPADDVLMARATGPDDLFLGDRLRHLTPIATPNVPTGVPVTGDFDGNGRDDILWYGAGSQPDTLWSTTGVGTFTATPRPVQGTYTPVAGDFDGDGDDDILWYAPGAATDQLWSGSPQRAHAAGPDVGHRHLHARRRRLRRRRPRRHLLVRPGSPPTTGCGVARRASPSPPRSRGRSRARYTPLAGDYDGDGRDDIFWYAPGSAADSLWRAATGGAFTPVATTSGHGLLPTDRRRPRR